MENSGLELKEFLKDAATRASLKESDIQAFLEDRPELIVRSKFMLNHGVFDNVVFSQFRIDYRIADFMYVTSSSAEATVVFVELEMPVEADNLFTQSNKTLRPGIALNKGLAQVKEWMGLMADPEVQLGIKSRIEKLLGLDGRRCRSLSYRYVLVIGADIGDSSSYPANVLQFLATEMASTPVLEICSYGSLARNYKQDFNTRPNIVSESLGRLKLKMLHSKPRFLSRIGPSEADLGIYRKKLIEHGYEISKWEKGELLTLHGKYTGGFDRAKEMGISPFQPICDLDKL